MSKTGFSMQSNGTNCLERTEVSSGSSVSEAVAVLKMKRYYGVGRQATSERDK
jgi:hypothetical protein